MNRITNKEIAEKLNISTATVSRALNGSGYVSHETKERIIELLKDSDPSFSDTAYLGMNRSLTGSSVAVIIPDISNTFFTDIIRGVESVARQYNMIVSFFHADESAAQEHRLMELVMQKKSQFKGLIIPPVAEADPSSVRYFDHLHNIDFPFVLVDRDIAKRSFDGVFVDNVKGSFTAVKTLVKAGHRDIAMIAFPTNVRPGRERRQGFIQAMKYYDLPVTEDFIQQGGLTVESGYECAKRLFSLKNRPTAIYSGNNVMTLGLLKYMCENDLHVGEDISVIAFDNIDILDYLQIPLSVITRSSFQMGVLAMQLLIDKISKTNLNSEPRRINVMPELDLRGSEKMPDKFRQ